MSGVPSANAARGEASIMVAGETLVLRPSFEALVAAEEELGPLRKSWGRMAEGKAVAARARDLVGTRFRPQERRREQGLDCVGLVALAGRLPVALVPAGYRMRSEVAEDVMALDFEGRVVMIAAADAGPGDVLLVRSGPAEWTEAGDLAISWVRRSRAGWTWLSGTDTPVGEESETYSLVISGTGYERTVTVSEPRYLYSIAEQATDNATSDIAVDVRQLGTFAPSRPANLIVPAQS